MILKGEVIAMDCIKQVEGKWKISDWVLTTRRLISETLPYSLTHQCHPNTDSDASASRRAQLSSCPHIFSGHSRQPLPYQNLQLRDRWTSSWKLAHLPPLALSQRKLPWGILYFQSAWECCNLVCERYLPSLLFFGNAYKIFAQGQTGSWDLSRENRNEIILPQPFICRQTY